MTSLETLNFAFSVTAPIFVMVLLGLGLKQLRMIDDDFIDVTSRLVFTLGLPVLLFFSSANIDFASEMADPRVLLVIGMVTLLVFVFSNLSASWFIQSPKDRGVLVQGAFRGNLIIIGLAFCVNAYGEEGLALATLPVALTIILYNMLSVYILNNSLSPAGRGSAMKVVRGIVRNPLIIGIALGLLANMVRLPIPDVVSATGDYLGQMVLPLALICIGGALDIKRVHHVDKATVSATVWKLLLSPIIACLLAVALGLSDKLVGVVFFLSAAPAATASFIMVQALNGNTQLAANIIVQSTLWSIFTVTLGFWVLQLCGLVS
ncbi:AEC family transporter [Marinimicrobium alkaliphilum]|uniref:AEC family transporter n=1 Tax=Marinimicrobium alkaliphilum TaxID=2202654 RepID=UPI001E2C5A06|nr:AEC family transporter [Marinimicrobium alkaliphilum]